ncbi:ATP-binding protein [Streptosporangium soli]|nr:ATP-binding protein [Streptosporangium sp. KLBMP 9127]
MSRDIMLIPRAEQLTLVALPNAVRIGRAYCKATLTGWGYRDDDFVADAELVVSELVTNAVNAVGPERGSHDGVRWGELLDHSTLIRLFLVDTRRALFVEVWDSDPRLPQPSAEGAQFDAESGRGLGIVAALSRHWGYRRPYDANGRRNGKVVFAELPLPTSTTSTTSTTGAAWRPPPP